jgi:hypothetical protein
MRTVSHRPDPIATYVDAGMFLRQENLHQQKDSCTENRTWIYWAVSGSRLIYVIARLPGQVAFGFLAVISGKAAFLVNRMSVFIGLAAFSVNALPAD